jgi:uncharacterized protein (TIGR02145 family)
MKTIIFSVALMLVTFGSSAQPGSITNLQVAQGTGAEERLVSIQFDLAGASDLYDIALEVSFDNGITFSPIAPAEITGSLSVAPGTGNQLVWDGRQTYGAVYAGNTRIRITLTSRRDTETVVVDVTNPTTGKTWMDRNLGASRAATSSTDAEAYGDLYQWGRAADGHQIRTSGTTSTLSTSDTPGHGNFILAPNVPYDWRSPQNDNLWQGVNGINNPCPPGYRLPTDAELDAERQSWSSNNSAGAFASQLKLPVAGYRNLSNGSLYYVGSYGYYWSGTLDGTASRNLGFDSIGASMSGYGRAFGGSVRCFKD